MLPRLTPAKARALWGGLAPLLIVLVEAGIYWLAARTWTPHSTMPRAMARAHQALRLLYVAHATPRAGRPGSPVSRVGAGPRATRARALAHGVLRAPSSQVGAHAPARPALGSYAEPTVSGRDAPMRRGGGRHTVGA